MILLLRHANHWLSWLRSAHVALVLGIILRLVRASIVFSCLGLRRTDFILKPQALKLLSHHLEIIFYFYSLRLHTLSHLSLGHLTPLNLIYLILNYLNLHHFVVLDGSFDSKIWKQLIHGEWLLSHWASLVAANPVFNRCLLIQVTIFCGDWIIDERLSDRTRE